MNDDQIQIIGMSKYAHRFWRVNFHIYQGLFHYPRNADERDRVQDWCNENCKDLSYVDQNWVDFDDETDAAMFVMAFS